MEDTYHIREDGKCVEVTKAQFVAVERRAGFRNTMGMPHEPATSAFSGNGLEGHLGFLHRD